MQATGEFVLGELQKVTKVTRSSATNVLIQCPFHQDKDPSCSVSLGGKVGAGVFFCFGCKAKGSWNTLADKLGLTLVDKEVVTSSKLLRDKIRLWQPHDPDKLDLSPVKKSWRRFPPDFLKRFGAKILWEESYNDEYLWFPVTWLGDYQGYIRAKIHSSSPGFKYWFNLQKKIPWPWDFIFKNPTKSIVLVEGVSDALRLIYHGVPALALLGTAIVDHYVDLLEALDLETLIVCFDGDKEGEKGALKAADTLEKAKFDVRVVDLPEGTDPDSASFFWIKLLKKMIKNTQGNLILRR